MRLTFSRKVEPDLRRIGRYIAKDNPRRAASFLEEFWREFEIIRASPYAFPVRADVTGDYRSEPYGEYVIFYRIREDMVRIERVLHGRRDLPYRIHT